MWSKVIKATTIYKVTKTTTGFTEEAVTTKSKATKATMTSTAAMVKTKF